MGGDHGYDNNGQAWNPLGQGYPVDNYGLEAGGRDLSNMGGYNSYQPSRSQLGNRMVTDHSGAN